MPSPKKALDRLAKVCRPSRRRGLLKICGVPRLEQAQQAIEHHFARQTVRVRLKRVRRENAVQMNHGPTLVFHETARQDTIDQGSHIRIAQMQPMAGAIAIKGSLVRFPDSRADDAAGFMLLFTKEIFAIKMQGARKAGQTGAEDEVFRGFQGHS